MAYSVDLRERVVGFVRDGGGSTEASRVFKVGRTTIHTWLSAESLEPKPAKTRKRKIDKAALAEHVRTHPDALLRERASEFNVRVSSMWEAMGKLKITKKNDHIR